MKIIELYFWEDLLFYVTENAIKLVVTNVLQDLIVLDIADL